MASAAMAFAAVLGGALVIDYGTKSLKKINTASGMVPGATAPTISTGNDKTDIQMASAKWHVPSWILWGVYGIETKHGADVATSTAGAMGKMQFMPPTARSYNYPLTNNPDPFQSAQQFDSAAHYLSDLFHETGSWASAIAHYSGGGYGLPLVQQEGAGAP